MRDFDWITWRQLTILIKKYRKKFKEESEVQSLSFFVAYKNAHRDSGEPYMPLWDKKEQKTKAQLLEEKEALFKEVGVNVK